MARRRMIDPDIWQNENFAKLSTLAKVVFIGLFSNADDEGKGRAKPVYVKSMLFPYDEDIRVADIDKTLQEIGSKMSVAFYTHNESKYYCLEHWNKWQRVDKPQPSKIPDPPSEKQVSNDTILLPEKAEKDIIPVPGSVGNQSGTIPESVGNQSGTIPESFRTKGKEVEVKGNRNRISISDTDAVEKLSNPDPELRQVCSAYQDNFLILPGKGIADEMQFYLNKGITAPALIKAIEKTAAAQAKWTYTRAVLNDWLAKGILTAERVDQEDQLFQSRKAPKAGSNTMGNQGIASSIDMDELQRLVDRGDV